MRLTVHDIDTRPKLEDDGTFNTMFSYALYNKSRMAPLYYGALCGRYSDFASEHDHRQVVDDRSIGLYSTQTTDIVQIGLIIMTL